MQEMFKKIVKKYRKISFLCYTYTVKTFFWGENMKIRKRYYVLIFVAVVCFGAILRDYFMSATFEIIKEQRVIAPEAEDIILTKEEYNGGKVNINSAGARELATLSGIGEKTAERIIEYREKHGNFEAVEDIMKVPGIGAQKFEEIKENITVKYQEEE